jgi:hypothetical protein
MLFVCFFFEIVGIAGGELITTSIIVEVEVI